MRARIWRGSRRDTWRKFISRRWKARDDDSAHTSVWKCQRARGPERGRSPCVAGAVRDGAGLVEQLAVAARAASKSPRATGATRLRPAALQNQDPSRARDRAPACPKISAALAASARNWICQHRSGLARRGRIRRGISFAESRTPQGPRRLCLRRLRGAFVRDGAPARDPLRLRFADRLLANLAPTFAK